MRRGWALGLLAGVALLAAGCGGSSSSSGGETTAAMTTEAQNSVQAAGNERVDAATWSSWEATRTKAQAVNQKSIATFRKCKSLVLSSASQEKVQTCMSTSASNVVSEGRNVQTALSDIAGKTTGACKTAATDLGGNVTLYIATVNSIDKLVKNADVPSSQKLDSALAQLGRTRTLIPPFEQACKPA